ncbi:MAG: carbamoyltransferase N-terminal domain-containing protein [Myxococcota bacterium]
MAAVLGVSAHYHDAAAALVVDGVIRAAVQEERLSRIKGDPNLPWRAISTCLEAAALAPGDLDRVVFYEEPPVKLERILLSMLHAYPRSFRTFVRGLRAQLQGKLWVLDALADGLELPRGKVTAAAHHHSHAASAYYPSAFEHAAVLTVDGVGEWDTTVIWEGRGELVRIADWHHPHSLGLFYAAITAFLGFAVNHGEYKVMGLAAYGQPRLVDTLRAVLRLESDGSFSLEPRFFDLTGTTHLGFTGALVDLLGSPRAPGRRWDLDHVDDLHYADVAASAQALLEEALLGLARRARRDTGATALCLAGGVALNAVANARIARDAGFSDGVFVPPAAGDAGAALGAALLGARDLGDPRPPPLTTAALGPPPDVATAHLLARELGLITRRLDDLAPVVERLARGQLIGWVQGNLEFGPRALGHRSLLSSPFDVGQRERINRAVKRREPFRPLAPSVRAADAARWFDGAPNAMTPFMTTVCPVREAARDRLGAVRHRDGTARVQTVRDGAFAELLRQFEGIGDAPILLNTSLNGRDEPIVATATDAIAFFLAHPIEALVVEDVLITRSK